MIQRTRLKPKRERRNNSTTIDSIFGRSGNVDRIFQIKYTKRITAVVGFAALFVGIVILYFINDNYNTFIKLSLAYFPALLKDLERERSWMIGIALSSMVVAPLATFIYFMKATGRFIAPVVILREHIRGVTRGEWFRPNVQIRQTDEFQDLVEHYNYLYKSIQLQSKKELEALKSIQAHVNNKESQQLLEELIEERLQQIDTTDKL